MTILASRDFNTDVSLGLIPGFSVERVFGRNPNIGNGTKEDIWFVGGDKVWQTSASTYDVFSSNLNDTSAGTGARTITIEGLDSNFDIQSEDIVMNGTTIVTTSNSYIRLNRGIVKDSGTYASSTLGSNLGNITIEINGGGDVQGIMPIGKGRTESSHFTVPNNKKALVENAIISVDANSPAEIFFIRRLGADIVAAPFSPKIESSIGSDVPAGIFPIDLELPLLVLPKTDIWFAALAGANNTIVAIGYDLKLVDI